MDVAVRLLGDGDQKLLGRALPEVFDNPVDPRLADAFLRDPRHHIVAAISGDRVAGFVSAVDYWHPDKPRELFVNEVSVSGAFRRRGIGTRLLRKALEHGRALGCVSAWVQTEGTNVAGNALYARVGGEPEGTNLVMYSFDLKIGSPEPVADLTQDARDAI